MDEVRREQPQLRQRLGDASDDLLDAVDDLRAMERQKRKETISSPPFHRLAEAIEAKSREISLGEACSSPEMAGRIGSSPKEASRPDR